MRGFAWLLISCLFVGLPACGSEDVITDASNDVVGSSNSSLYGTEWILIDYRIAWLADDLKNRASIVFNSSVDNVHLASGKCFVNGYSGNFRIDEERKLISSVDHIISTKIGGSPKENAAESNFFENLIRVKSYELAGDYLTLYFDNKEVGYFVRKK